MIRNKNVIIAIVLGVFLLGTNIFVVQKYRILKEHYKKQVTENSMTGKKEIALWVNSQVALSMDGRKMPNILLKEYNDSTISLKDYMINKRFVFVVRVNELHCSDCVNFILEKMGRLSQELNFDNHVLYLGTYQTPTVRRYLEKNMKLSSCILNVDHGEFSLPLEEDNFPYCFLLSDDRTILHTFIPDKVVPDLTNSYLKNISQRYFQTNKK